LDAAIKKAAGLAAALLNQTDVCLTSWVQRPPESVGCSAFLRENGRVEERSVVYGVYALLHH
jgi:hypothetical protein